MAEKMQCGGEPVLRADNQEIDRDERDHEPAFVASQRCRNAGNACANHRRERLGFAKQDGEVEQGHQRRQDHRLGHRSGLQVQKIRIERQQPERRQRNGGRMRGAPHGRVQENAGANETSRGRDGARQAAAPQADRSDTSGSISSMRQRQPDGPQLIVAGLSRVDDAARDVEMRLRIAIIQSPAGMVYVRGSQAADRGQRDEDQREFKPDVLQDFRFKTR